MPTPTEIKYGEYVLSKAERNLLGNMAFAYINKKIRIDVSVDFQANTLDVRLKTH